MQIDVQINSIHFVVPLIKTTLRIDKRGIISKIVGNTKTQLHLK